MKPQMRRILAYVIARLTADVESNTLYDYQEVSYFNFNGTVKKDAIRVQDYSDSLYLKGTGTTTGKETILNLLDDAGNSIKVVMKEESDEVTFTGTGRGQSMNFHGVAEKTGKVSFYDSATGLYYRLKI